MAVSFAEALRGRIYGALAAAGAGVTRGGIESPRISWLISGDSQDGLAASFSDADDVIEFGLLSRVSGEPSNVLNVSIALDGDSARIFSVSDARDDLNFEGRVGAEQSDDGLSKALEYFAQVAGSAVPE